LSADAESDARDLAPHCAGLEAAEVSGLVYSDYQEQLAQELPVLMRYTPILRKRSSRNKDSSAAKLLKESV
jgi:hypothetical protein